jgi:transposase
MAGGQGMNTPQDVKARFLADHHALHPRPERVRDTLFQQDGFFDPRDLVQVRYELLRRHLVDKQPVTELIRDFGISRQMFYVLLRMFQQEGLAGLLPRKRGPKSAHKCTDAILAFVVARREESPGRSAKELAEDVGRKFGVQLHPRTLERRLSQRGKKRRPQTIRTRR